MSSAKSYFFCGIGGSGMLPLASIVRARGAAVAGSDRSLDQGRTPEKFAYLRDQGIALFPQDGSGITSAEQIIVTSAAVEDTVPDVQAARRVGATHLMRPELLADLFNSAPTRVGVAGTSGKSTVTGMIAWILHCAGRDPTVMNGAVMKNFVSADTPFASALVGGGDGVFVSEVDESDGSIALYDATVAVLNNISLDHKSMEELRELFGGFVARAQVAVLNLDDAEAARFAERAGPARVLTYGIDDPRAELRAVGLAEEPFAIAFTAVESMTGRQMPVRLAVPGRHNVSNALAALSAAHACGVDLTEGAAALAGFTGLRRRFELVGEVHGIVVIDDFGHNPDKIAATLAALRAFPGRLLILFQPHGYGPLKVLKDGLIETFATGMAPDDVLIMPDPAYFGGTVTRAVGSGDIVAGIAARDRTAHYIPDRAAAGDMLVEMARRGDRIVVMGARDDTLSTFAARLVERLRAG